MHHETTCETHRCDHEGLRELIDQVLNAHGYKTIIADSGESAAPALQRVFKAIQIVVSWTAHVKSGLSWVRSIASDRGTRAADFSQTPIHLLWFLDRHLRFDFLLLAK